MKNSSYKSFDDLPLMLSVPEVANVLGISRAGAYELVKTEGFPSLTIGSRIIVPGISSWPGSMKKARATANNCVKCCGSRCEIPQNSAESQQGTCPAVMR